MTDDRFRYDHPSFGIEFDWLAYDLDGLVGLMLSAGYGPVPVTVFERSADLDPVQEGAVQRLPVVGSFRSEKVAPVMDCWERPAGRGLYCFDWDHWRGPYRRASVPEKPGSIDDLPEDLARLALLAALPVCFRDCRAFDLTELGVAIALQGGDPILEDTPQHTRLPIDPATPSSD